MQDNNKVELFEKVPVPKAVAQLAVPTILSSLVMVLYNLRIRILWEWSMIPYRMQP